MGDSVVVNEIFLSLQGESSFAGLPCVFVRLTGCDLRCSYCDTAYAFGEGQRLRLEEVCAEVRRLAGGFGRSTGGARLPLVELTGGEPLLQAASRPLMSALCDEGWTVLLETSGAHDISGVDPRVHRIMDLKCPASGESARNRWSNLPHLRSSDEIKFVITTSDDYEWTKQVIAEHRLETVCPLLVSWAQPLTTEQRHPALRPSPAEQHLISRRELAERIIADGLPVRFQAQLHKIIWPADQRGV